MTPHERMAGSFLNPHTFANTIGKPKALWATLPLVSRAPAMFHTDHSAVHPGVMPAEQQRAMTKQARKTKHIERFTTTLRQRVSRLVRATRSFSKQLAHHLGAITYFLCHYHLTRRVALPV
jgi:insertion element IS1 protein InsB